MSTDVNSKTAEQTEQGAFHGARAGGTADAAVGVLGRPLVECDSK